MWGLALATNLMHLTPPYTSLSSYRASSGGRWPFGESACLARAAAAVFDSAQEPGEHRCRSGPHQDLPSGLRAARSVACCSDLSLHTPCPLPMPFPFSTPGSSSASSSSSPGSEAPRATWPFSVSRWEGQAGWLGRGNLLALSLLSSSST